MKLRKVFVLREVQIPMEDLKTGDIFRMEPASETDLKCSQGYWQCTEDSCLVDNPAWGRVPGVDCKQIDIVDVMGHNNMIHAFSDKTKLEHVDE